MVPQFDSSSCTNLWSTYQPTNIHVRKPPNGRHIFAENQSRKLKRLPPNSCREYLPLSDSEQSAPMTIHISDTTRAAPLRPRCNSSLRNDVETSWSDMFDVKAAMVSSI